MSLGYSKVKDIESMSLDLLNISDVQFYSPILNSSFVLNDSNFNMIILKSELVLRKILKKETYNTYECKLVNSNIGTNMLAYFKFSPLFDPVKYCVNKVENLPSSFVDCLPKFNTEDYRFECTDDKNNMAYVDGFFTYLSSVLLVKYQFINGVNFFGSFIGLKNDFKYDILDELDVVVGDEEFKKNLNDKFTVDNSFNELMSEYENEDKGKKMALNILDEYETLDETDIECIDSSGISVDEVNLEGDVNNEVSRFIFEKIVEEGAGIELGETDEDSCSSTSSNTLCSEVLSDTDIKNGEEEINEKNKEDDENSKSSEYEDSEGEGSDEDHEEGEGSDEDDEDYEEGEMNVYIDKYPVNVIVMEKLDNTLEYYMNNEDLDDSMWKSILLQVIFTLITYSDIFSLTHNDLHSSNIMYKETDKKYIVYCYNEQYYKVPTYGKIWKIIDFGRAIFNFNDTLYCSNSFSKNGDAATQYNFYPYYNENKCKIEPNPSFDLCRLACSLFDYFFDDIEEIRDEGLDSIQQIISEWCKDDSGRNIIYKRNGDERYPDFKLYKMIARQVHNHTPHSQLNKDIFKEFIVKKKSAKKLKVIDIDDMKRDISLNKEKCI